VKTRFTLSKGSLIIVYLILGNKGSKSNVKAISLRNPGYPKFKHFNLSQAF